MKLPNLTLSFLSSTCCIVIIVTLLRSYILFISQLLSLVIVFCIFAYASAPMCLYLSFRVIMCLYCLPRVSTNLLLCPIMAFNISFFPNALDLPKPSLLMMINLEAEFDVRKETDGETDGKTRIQRGKGRLTERDGFVDGISQVSQTDR